MGWMIFRRPLLAFIGFLVGSLIDSAEVYVGTPKNVIRTSQNEFLKSLLVLIAATMKADGKVMQSELDYVKRFLYQNFGEVTALECLRQLREMLNTDLQVTEECLQVRNHMDYSSRLQILHFLFGVALADGVISQPELKTIENIAWNMGINNADLNSIKSMFIEETDWAYSVLEIEKNCTNDEVKKAYRKMAMKYHPDKVSTLGEEVKKAATEKFRKLNDAYEKIKKERGMV